MKEVMNAGSYGKKANHFQREATAYAVGYVECWLKEYAASIGLSYQEVAHGIFSALGNTGPGADVPVSEVRGAAARSSHLLQSKMEMVGGPSKRRVPPPSKARLARCPHCPKRFKPRGLSIHVGLVHGKKKVLAKAA